MNNPSPAPFSLLGAIRKMSQLGKGEGWQIVLAVSLIVVNSGLNLFAPYLIGRTIDTYVQQGNFSGVLTNAAILLGLFLVAFGTNYVQMMVMGGVGQRVLFKLRNTLFAKLQELPSGFFQEQKAGDLISRINNDTDKLSQFFSEMLMRFLGSFFMIAGAGIFLVSIRPALGFAAVLPAITVVVITRLTAAWVKSKNAASLQAIGAMSAEVQEGLSTFKVTAVFHRRDYLKQRFQEAAANAFNASWKAGLANGVFTPSYDLAANTAQLLVVGLGAWFIARGQATVGIIISFLLYVDRFYQPFRQIAMVWSTLQTALAAWDRLSAILALTSDLVQAQPTPIASSALVEFKNVSFRYKNADKNVLHSIGFALEKGKTYALVGPTGGGKTTTASLMARLYDPTEGVIVFDGRDLRSYTSEERARCIGFILQEPFLFSGTLRENIVYQNSKYEHLSDEAFAEVLREHGLDALLSRFPEGLNMTVQSGSESLSLGQKQLIAFMRAVLREPDLLILDEATANIDTITEQLLENILAKLPPHTTRVIIAHRLNTIKNADEIFFVNNGEIVAAGSFEKALELLLHGKRTS